MKREGIEKHHTAFVKNTINGTALVELKTLLILNHPAIFDLLRKMKKAQWAGEFSVGDMLCITSALRKLNA